MSDKIDNLNAILQSMQNDDTYNFGNDDDHSDFVSRISETHYFSDSEYVKLAQSRKTDFKVLSLNIESLNAKFDTLCVYLEQMRTNGIIFDALCIQETWLDSYDNVKKFQFDIYEMIFQSKSASGKGGLIIYLNKIYTKYKKLDVKYSTNVWECQLIEIPGLPGQKSLVIGNIYRPPRSTKDLTDKFINEFGLIMHNLSKKYSTQVALFGDYNIDLLQIDKLPLANNFVNTLFSSSFVPKISVPTRITSHSSTLIDNVLCSYPHDSSDISSGVLLNKLSDHQSYFASFTVKLMRTMPPKYIKIRKQTECNLMAFKASFHNSNVFEDVCDLNSDTNHNYDRFSSVVIESHDEHIPLVTVKFNKYKHKIKPWRMLAAREK